MQAKNNFPVCCLSLRESRYFRGAKGDDYYSATAKNAGETPAPQSR
jgi:hypothetical protein